MLFPFAPTCTPVAPTPPNVTLANGSKSVPLIVTAVPPAVGPFLGATTLTDGVTAAYVATTAWEPGDTETTALEAPFTVRVWYAAVDPSTLRLASRPPDETSGTIIGSVSVPLGTVREKVSCDPSQLVVPKAAFA